MSTGGERFLIARLRGKPDNNGMTVMCAPVLLVIRDGWGSNPHPVQNGFNAVYLARKPCDDRLRAKYPVTLVAASGLDVGLPDGQMGNSEVGHENIGAGRIVDQELVRLNKLFSEKKLAQNPIWHAIVARLKVSPALFRPRAHAPRGSGLLPLGDPLIAVDRWLSFAQAKDRGQSHRSCRQNSRLRAASFLPCPIFDG